MVRGLDVFRYHFQEFQEQFVVIGGIACHMLMAVQDLKFRTTKDFDIVLMMEVIDGKFIDRFWEFIRAGKYSNIQKSTGEKIYYRFLEPSDGSYPVMLELFSRKPELIGIPEDQHIVPIPIEENISSLSAILMVNDYNDMVRENVRIVDGLPILILECLIALKARAWLDMTARIEQGDVLDSRELKKHRNDIFRLSQILAIGGSFILPDKIRDDLGSFLKRFPASSPEWPSIITACGTGYLPEPQILIQQLMEYFSLH